MKRLFPLLLLSAVNIGCSSIRSSMWTRAEDESLHPDPCQNLCGIPVMLKVPSHIEVKVIETLYAAHDPGTGVLEVVRLRRPDLSVYPTLKYTEKMFLIDPVRVASGTGAYGFGFSPGEKQKEILPDDSSTAGASSGHGYLHSANYIANDQTIANAGKLVQAVLNFPGVRGTGAPTPGNLNLVTIDRVVAFRRFDLAAADCDAQVFAFLEDRVNHCHLCNYTPRTFSSPDITAPETGNDSASGDKKPTPIPVTVVPGNGQ